MVTVSCHLLRVKFICMAPVSRHFTSSEMYIYGSCVAALLLCVKFISMAAVSWHFISTAKKLVDDPAAVEPETVQESWLGREA